MEDQEVDAHPNSICSKCFSHLLSQFFFGWFSTSLRVSTWKTTLYSFPDHAERTRRFLLFWRLVLTECAVHDDLVENSRTKKNKTKLISWKKQSKSGNKRENNGSQVTWMTKTPDKVAFAVQLQRRAASYPTSWIVVKILAIEPAKVKNVVGSESWPVCLFIIFLYIWGHLDSNSIGKLVRGKMY